MEALFNRDKISNVVLVGMGNLGLALSRYGRFALRGINIVATFDIDPFKQKMRSDPQCLSDGPSAGDSQQVQGQCCHHYSS